MKYILTILLSLFTLIGYSQTRYVSDRVAINGIDYMDVNLILYVKDSVSIDIINLDNNDTTHIKSIKWSTRIRNNNNTYSTFFTSISCKIDTPLNVMYFYSNNQLISLGIGNSKKFVIIELKELYKKEEILY